MLREVDQRLGVLSRQTQCLIDCRAPELIEHDVQSLLAQRIRRKLFRIGARISVTARKVWLSLLDSYPYQRLHARILRQRQGYPIWEPG